MAFTLSDLIRGAIRRQGIDAFDIRIATSGSTTTLTDTTLEDKYGDDELLDGTIIVTATASGGAPQGQYSRITAYSEADMQATFGALTDPIAAGDTCMIISPEYPLRIMTEFANEAVKECGKISLLDTTLTTVDDVTEYDLRTEAKDVVAVYVQGVTDETDYNAWERISNYRVVPSEGNVDTTLILPKTFDAGKQIVVVYNTFHPELTVYNSPISESIPAPLVTIMLADKIMEWHGVTDENRNSANKIQSELENAKRIYTVSREPKLMKTLWYRGN